MFPSSKSAKVISRWNRFFTAVQEFSRILSATLVRTEPSFPRLKCQYNRLLTYFTWTCRELAFYTFLRTKLSTSFPISAWSNSKIGSAALARFFYSSIWRKISSSSITTIQQGVPTREIMLNPPLFTFPPLVRQDRFQFRHANIFQGVARASIAMLKKPLIFTISDTYSNIYNVITLIGNPIDGHGSSKSQILFFPKKVVTFFLQTGLFFSTFRTAITSALRIGCPNKKQSFAHTTTNSNLFSTHWVFLFYPTKQIYSAGKFLRLFCWVSNDADNVCTLTWEAI